MVARPAALRYVETSALLAGLLEGDTAVAASLNADGVHVASALTFAEGFRAVARARAMGRFDAVLERRVRAALAAFEKRCDVVGISEQILAAVRRPFPVEPVRTLDAIHLASVQSLGESPQSVIIVTRDKRIRANAVAMGFGIE